MYVYALVDDNYGGLAPAVPMKEVTGTGYVIDETAEAAPVAQGGKYYYEGSSGDTIPRHYKDLLDAFWSNKADGGKRKRNPAWETYEKYFLVGRKMQQTTDESGVSINHDKASIRRDPHNSLAFQFILQESFGLLDADDNDIFKTVVIQITGPVDNGGYLNKYIVDESVDGDGKYKNFVSGFLNSNPVFIHAVTADGGISPGNYSAVIKIYKERASEITDAVVPYDTWTFQTY